MSTPRIPPVPPNKGGELDKTAPSDHRKVQKIEKVSKVSETDDESRARQFRQFIDADEEEPSTLPTPFALFSLDGDSNASLADVDESALPSPAYSPPPSAILGGTAAQEDSLGGGEEPSLPSATPFWGSVDEPPDPNQPPMQPQMEETPRSASSVFFTTKASAQEEIQDTDGKKSVKKGAETSPKRDLLSQPSPFGPPGKPILGTKGELPLSEKTEEASPAKAKKGGPKGVIAPKREKKYIAPLGLGKMKTSEQGDKSTRPLTEEEEKRLGVSSKGPPQMRGDGKWPENGHQKPIGPIQSLEGKGETGKKKSERQEAPIQIDSPTTASFPAFCLPMANGAAAAAKPYLGPDALSIYFHMIGTITAMVSPRGDSQTEFVLNAPSFANSQFFGAKITIDRFSTAPYQLNIRLTGTTAAVSQFNQNIPNLLAAFRNGKFSYTINRIEAVYEKPLFHRKESAREKGEGFGGNMDHKQ